MDVAVAEEARLLLEAGYPDALELAAAEVDTTDEVALGAVTGPTEVAEEFRLKLKLALEVGTTVLVMCTVELRV